MMQEVSTIFFRRELTRYELNSLILANFHALSLIFVRSHWIFLNLLKLVNNSTSYNKGNHNRDGGFEIWS